MVKSLHESPRPAQHPRRPGEPGFTQARHRPGGDQGDPPPGTHNKRSHVTVTARTNDFVWIEELVDLVEKQASSELYGLLKRPDEKHVTERAYDNPKFVEDLVRDVAAVLNLDERVDAYVVESENFESIHNHSAYALIEKDKRK